MKFAMGADVLTSLSKKTSTSTEDLATLVRRLAAVSEQVEGRVNGATRKAFDDFQRDAENIAVELTTALGGVLSGMKQMDAAFIQGEQQMADEITQARTSSSFDAGRFGASRS